MILLDTDVMVDILRGHQEWTANARICTLHSCIREEFVDGFDTVRAASTAVRDGRLRNRW